MPNETKTFTFEMDENSTIPLWSQLRKRIVALIGSGYFKPGDQLPKIRELAVDLSINFNTVNKAYLSLQTDGYLKSVRGRGVFVTDIAASPMGESGEVEAVLDDCLKACKALGLSYDEAVSRMRVRATRLKMQEATPRRAEGTNVITLRVDEGSAEKGA